MPLMLPRRLDTRCQRTRVFISHLFPAGHDRGSFTVCLDEFAVLGREVGVIDRGS